MIIAVSIVDKHRPEGHRHIGTYCFEIDYPAADHEGQMDFYVKDCVPEGEAEARKYLNCLMTVENMPRPVRVTTQAGKAIRSEPING